MLWKLLYKEFKLTNIAVFIFVFTTALLTLVSNWPVMLPFLYCMMNTYLLFVYSVQNKDLDYTVTLPIAKCDVVKARVLYVATLQLITILLSIVFMVIKYKFNLFVTDAFVTLYNVGTVGYLFVILGITDFVFMSFAYLKTDTKYLPQFFSSMIVFMILCVPHWILLKQTGVYAEYMGGFSVAEQIRQIPVLAGGILLWVLFHFFGYKIGAKCFEKIDM